MGEFASKGLAGTALGFGIGGTALGVLGGGLTNLLGGLNGAQPAAQAAQTAAVDTTAAMAAMVAAMNLAGRSNGACSEDHTINRYEAQKDARIAELETEVKLRDANTYTDQKLLDMYKYFDGELKGVRQNLCDQAVWNATQTSTISCMGQQIAALQSVMQGLTKIVIPNSSVCPGWGETTVSVSTGTTAA